MTKRIRAWAWVAIDGDGKRLTYLGSRYVMYFKTKKEATRTADYWLNPYTIKKVQRPFRAANANQKNRRKK